MSDPHAITREIDRSHMQVSDEVAIQISSMNKWYGAFHVLRDINMTVNRGERIVICGPSGSGPGTPTRTPAWRTPRPSPATSLARSMESGSSSRQ